MQFILVKNSNGFKQKDKTNIKKCFNETTTILLHLVMFLKLEKPLNTVLLNTEYMLYLQKKSYLPILIMV